MAGGAAGGAAPALQARQALLQGRHRGIGEAGIDEAEGLQIEQRGGVVRVVKDVGGVLKIGVWRAPVTGSGCVPAWIIRVSNPGVCLFFMPRPFS